MNAAVSRLNNKIQSRMTNNMYAKNNLNSRNVRNARTARNNDTSNNSATRQSIVLALSIVLVLAVLIAAGRWLWRYYNDEQKVEVSTITLLDGANRGDNEFTISSSQMPPSTYSNEYALSFWIYVDDYNYRRDQDKYILRRGSISRDGAVNPEVILHPFHNTLEVAIQLQTDKSPSRASQHHHPECAKSTDYSSESFYDAKSTIVNKVHPSRPLKNNYFAVMDGQEILPNPAAGKELGYKLAKLHIESSEKFQDTEGEPVSTGSSNNNSAEASTSNNASNNNASNSKDADKCECTCDSDEYVPMTRDEWKASTASCQVPDFPLQKWVHVVISQYNQVLDLYIDGHLASSCPMPGFPAISTDGLSLCPDGGFSGRISRVTYSNTSLSASDVHSIYTSGPDSSYKPIRQGIPMWVIGVVLVAILLAVALIFI